MWAVTTETSETCDLKLHKLTATEHQQKPVSQLNLEICGVINYGSDWRKDVINQCLEFGVWDGGRRRSGAPDERKTSPEPGFEPFEPAACSLLTSHAARLAPMMMRMMRNADM